jgi:hypothetical protein
MNLHPTHAPSSPTHNATPAPSPQPPAPSPGLPAPSPERPDASQIFERQNYPNGPQSPSGRTTYKQRASKHKNRPMRQDRPEGALPRLRGSAAAPP